MPRPPATEDRLAHTVPTGTKKGRPEERPKSREETPKKGMQRKRCESSMTR